MSLDWLFLLDSEWSIPLGSNNVLIGRYEIKDKWRPKWEVWVPFALKYHVNAYYANEKVGSLGSAYPIKKATIYEIVNYAKRVEQLTRPTNIVNFDKDETWIDTTLYRLSCETDPLPEHFPLKRYSVEEFLNKDKRKYGDEMLKRCYLNPFEFEKEYPHLIKEANKKWWSFIR